MRALIIAVLVLVTGITLGVVGWEWSRSERGPRFYVLLDEQAGLERGDPVYLGNLEIGRVEDVGRANDRVRVTARLREDQAATLTAATTFKVETGGLVDGTRRLAAYVLDAAAPMLAADSTVEGVDSSLELALRTGASRAGAAIGRVAQAAWLQHGAEALAEFRHEIETTDWDRVGRDLERSFAEVGREFDEIAQQSGPQADATLRALKPKVDQVLREVEAVANSAEATRLRSRLAELWRAALASHDRLPPGVPTPDRSSPAPPVIPDPAAPEPPAPDPTH